MKKYGFFLPEHTLFVAGWDFYWSISATQQLGRVRLTSELDKAFLVVTENAGKEYHKWLLEHCTYMIAEHCAAATTAACPECRKTISSPKKLIVKAVSVVYSLPEE